MALRLCTFMCDNCTRMAGKLKINKETAVQICADLLYSGKTRKEILQHFAEKCKASERGIDNWIKEARVVVSQRQQAAEEIKVRVEAEQIEAIANELGLTRRAMLAELKKVAMMDPRKLYKSDGTPKETQDWDDETAGAIAGVEIFEEFDPKTRLKIGTTRKVKKEPKLTAIAEINKMMGYYPATAGIKAEIEDKKEGKVFKVTLNLG